MYKPQKGHLERGPPNPKLRGRKPITIQVMSWVQNKTKLVVPKKAACREFLASKVLVLEAVHVVALWVALVQQLLMDNFRKMEVLIAVIFRQWLVIVMREKRKIQKVTSPENHLFSPPKKNKLHQISPHFCYIENTPKNTSKFDQKVCNGNESFWVVLRSRPTLQVHCICPFPCRWTWSDPGEKNDFFWLGNQKKKHHR